MAVIIDFFKENIFWFLFAIVTTAIIFIYTRLDTSAKLSIKKFFSPKMTTAFIIAIIWLIWSRNGGVTTIKVANLWIPIISLVIMVGYNFIGGLRYESQQIICANGVHGSYSRPPYRVNGFFIYALDSFNAGGLSWDFAGRILVLREETVQFMDEGSVSISRPTVCNTWAYDLEPELKEFVENNKFLKGRNKPVFYGWFDDLEQIDWNFEHLNNLSKDDGDAFELIKKEFSISNPKISTLFWSYKSLCKAINKQTEHYDATIESVEKGVEHNKRVKDAYIEKGGGVNEMQTGHEEY